MAFFTTGSGYDLNLLTEAAMISSERDRVAAEVEREIVSRYTDLLIRRPLGADYDEVLESDNVRGVFLRGYNADVTLAEGYDADSAIWSGFAATLRGVIANVISHRVEQIGIDTTITSESRGSRSITRSRPVNKRWPDAWDEPLKHYDLRVPAYHL